MLRTLPVRPIHLRPTRPGPHPFRIALSNGRNFDGLHVFTENPANTASAAWLIEDGRLRCPHVIWSKSIEAQVQTNRVGDFATFFATSRKEEIVAAGGTIDSQAEGMPVDFRHIAPTPLPP